MEPLVSCICITRDRRQFIAGAIDCFLSQKWPNKELIVIDDGDDLVGDLFRNVTNSRYAFLRGTHKIGNKRNLACMIASGQIIAHWDDDDWSAPERIRDQVERLLGSGKSVTGYRSMLFTDGARAFRYRGSAKYAIGSSLCFTRDFWRRHNFIDDHRMTEDNAFAREARDANQLICVDAGELMVARIHPGNTCLKKPLENPEQWSSADLAELPMGFLRTQGVCA